MVKMESVWLQEGRCQGEGVMVSLVIWKWNVGIKLLFCNVFSLVFLFSQGSSAMTILCLHKLPSRPWMVSRLAWRGWRFSWNAPRTTANPTDPSPGAFPLPSSKASTARVSSPSSQGHHSRDSVGQGDRSPSQEGDSAYSLKKKKKMFAMIFPHFCCISFLRFCHVIWVWFSILMYMIIYDYHWSRCSLEVFCVTVFSGEHQMFPCHFIAFRSS